GPWALHRLWLLRWRRSARRRRPPRLLLGHRPGSGAAGPRGVPVARPAYPGVRRQLRSGVGGRVVSSRAKTKQANRIVREQLAAEARRRRAITVSIVAVAVLLLAGLVGIGIYLNQKPAANSAVPAGTTSGHTGIPVSSGSVPV